jgi:hypothetical protein
VSRSKRLYEVAHAASFLLEPPDRGRSAPQVHLVRLGIFLTLIPDVLLDLVASSRPTIETKYPLVQKCCPTKLRFFWPYTRAKSIALLPLMYPTTCDTAYFGGIANHMHVFQQQMPPSIRLSFCSASRQNTSPRYFLSSLYSVLLRHFGINQVIFAIPLRMA